MSRPDPDPPQVELSFEQQRMVEEMTADLCAARREHISTCDDRQAVPGVSLRTLQASRRSNVPGTFAHQKLIVNKPLIDAWQKYSSGNDEENSDNLDSIMDGQSHRVGLNATQRVPPSGPRAMAGMRSRAPVRGAHIGRGRIIAGTRGRGGSFVPCQDPSLERNFSAGSAKPQARGRGRGGFQPFRSRAGSVPARGRQLIIDNSHPGPSPDFQPLRERVHSSPPARGECALYRTSPSSRGGAQLATDNPVHSASAEFQPAQGRSPCGGRGRAPDRSSPSSRAGRELGIENSAGSDQPCRNASIYESHLRTPNDFMESFTRNFRTATTTETGLPAPISPAPKTSRANPDKNVPEARTPQLQQQRLQGNLLEMTPPSAERRGISGLPSLSPAIQSELTGLSILYDAALKKEQAAAAALEQAKTATQEQTAQSAIVEPAIVQPGEIATEAKVEKDSGPVIQTPVARTPMSRSEWELQVLQLTNGLHKLMESRPLAFLDEPVFAGPVTPTPTGMYASRSPERYHDSTSSSGEKSGADKFESPSPRQIHSQSPLPEFSKLRISGSLPPEPVVSAPQIVVKENDMTPGSDIAKMPGTLAPDPVVSAPQIVVQENDTTPGSAIAQMPGTLTPDPAVKAPESSKLEVKSPIEKLVLGEPVAISPVTASKGLAIVSQKKSEPIKRGGLDSSKFARGGVAKIPALVSKKLASVAHPTTEPIKSGGLNASKFATLDSSLEASGGVSFEGNKPFNPLASNLFPPAIVDSRGMNDENRNPQAAYGTGHPTSHYASAFVRPGPYAPIPVVSPAQGHANDRAGNRNTNNDNENEYFNSRSGLPRVGEVSLIGPVPYSPIEHVPLNRPREPRESDE